MTARVLVLLAATVAILAGCGGSSGGTTSPPSATKPQPLPSSPALGPAAVRVRAELGSLRQRGLLLGKASAPVQIIEYASLDCRECARVHRAVVPAVIAQYVRTGIASLEFRSVADTPVAQNLALGAYAASSQRRGWNFIQLAYLRALPQGTTPDTPARLAAALGLDRGRFRSDLRNPEWQILLKGAASVVHVAGFTGDPVFLVHRPGEPFTVLTEPRTIHAFTKAIIAARGGHA